MYNYENVQDLTIILITLVKDITFMELLHRGIIILSI